jgi:hypothetical protein
MQRAWVKPDGIVTVPLLVTMLGAIGYAVRGSLPPGTCVEAWAVGVRAFVVVESVADNGPAAPAATVGTSAATAMDGTPVVVVFFTRPVASPDSAVPLIFATVGPGYVPDRSPDAVPDGAREFVVVESVAARGLPAVPAADPEKSVAAWDAAVPASEIVDRVCVPVWLARCTANA